MTAAQPDPAETVRLLPADTFTQQTREEWVEVIKYALADRGGYMWAPDDFSQQARFIVDALLAHLAAQQPRPMPGGADQ